MARRALTLADLPEKVRMDVYRQLREQAGKPPARPAGQPLTPSGGTGTPQQVQRGKNRLKMTKTEAEFARILDIQKSKGQILHWEYEAITLRWGVLDVIRYTPDFTIFDSIEVDDLTPEVPRIKMRFIEVKGAHIWPKDMQKFKAARNKWYGTFHFELHQKTKSGWNQLL